MSRIFGNKKIYYAVFYSDNQTRVKIIYEIEPGVPLEETERKPDASGNEMSHVGFSESRAGKNGKVVCRDEEAGFNYDV